MMLCIMLVLVGFFNLPFILTSKPRGNWWNPLAMGICFGIAISQLISVVGGK